MPLDRENKSFQITTETVKRTCQILKTVWQQVADHWTSSRCNNNSAENTQLLVFNDNVDNIPMFKIGNSLAVIPTLITKTNITLISIITCGQHPQKFTPHSTREGTIHVYDTKYSRWKEIKINATGYRQIITIFLHCLGIDIEHLRQKKQYHFPQEPNSRWTKDEVHWITQVGGRRPPKN